jgi:hypothetical protein
MDHFDTIVIGATPPTTALACPDLTTFCRLDELGLKVVGQRLEPEPYRAVLAGTG